MGVTVTMPSAFSHCSHPGGVGQVAQSHSPLPAWLVCQQSELAGTDGSDRSGLCGHSRHTCGTQLPSPGWCLTARFHTARFHTSHFTPHLPTPAPTQLRIYEDEDGARKEEIAALAQPESGSFAAFYDRLKEVKEYYRRFPTTDVTEVRGVLGWDGRGRVGW